MAIPLRKRLEQHEVTASAPCRVDMGGTLDLSTFFLPLHHLKPCTFNAALNMRTHVKLLPFKQDAIRIVSTGFPPVEVDSASLPFNHALGLMCAVAAYFNADGVEIRIESCSPPRSALGGSSSAAVALIRAFAKALLEPGHALFDPAPVAILAHAIEQSVAGVPCGMQDQLAAAFGGVNAWCWSAPASGPAFNRKTLVAGKDCSVFSQQILVAYCGEPHVSEDINGTWVRLFLAGKHRRQWKDIVQCAHQFIDALSKKDLFSAQAAMNHETEIRRKMTPAVLDNIGCSLVDTAREHGCGARFTGAGGGGCVWALGSVELIRALNSKWRDILRGHPSARLLETAIDMDGVL